MLQLIAVIIILMLKLYLMFLKSGETLPGDPPQSPPAAPSALPTVSRP